MNKPILMGAVAGLALLAGCQAEPVSNTTVSNQTVIANTAAEVPEAKIVPAAADETAGLAVNLAPDELTLVLPNGSSRHVSFGTDKAAALKMVGAALGNPIEQSRAEDCGAGAMDDVVFRQGLSLYFQEDKFAGWDLDGRENGKYTTGNGIGIGTTRKELEAAGDVTVEDSSIGVEFTMGDMSGLLSDKSPAGKVTNLWAGVNCIAR